MSLRTVVAIEPAQDGAQLKLIKAPVVIEQALRPHPFGCDADAMPNWQEEHAVRLHGERILAELCQHPAVKVALENLSRSPHGEVRSLYFHLMVEDAEQLCWETLCDQQGRFLALDRRWPIGRMADSLQDHQPPLCNFDPPLRIVAVLSALGVDAEPEWRRLMQAVVDATDEIPTHLTLLSSQRELIEAVSEEIAQGRERLQVEAIPIRTSELERRLGELRPQLLHFFCHGTVSHGLSRLELATVLDEDNGEQTSSLKLDLDGLPKLGGLEDLWLVTLNCCRGARGCEQTHSMAHRLVARGVPAAVGMLEPVTASDAHEFCGSFYDSLFEHLATTLGLLEEGESTTFEWTPALRAARLNLIERQQRDATRDRQWSLPVLYVTPLQIQLRKEDPRAKGNAAAPAANEEEWTQRAGLIAGMLKNLPPSASDEDRDRFLELLADVPERLRPDRFGSFPEG